MITSIPMPSEETILQRVVETDNKELMEELRDQILEGFVSGFQEAVDKEAFVKGFVNNKNLRLYATMVITSRKWVKEGINHARAATFLLQAALMERGNDKAWVPAYEQLRATHPHLLIAHIMVFEAIANPPRHPHLQIIH